MVCRRRAPCLMLHTSSRMWSSCTSRSPSAGSAQSVPFSPLVWSFRCFRLLWRLIVLQDDEERLPRPSSRGAAPPAGLQARGACTAAHARPNMPRMPARSQRAAQPAARRPTLAATPATAVPLLKLNSAFVLLQ